MTLLRLIGGLGHGGRGEAKISIQPPHRRNHGLIFASGKLTNKPCQRKKLKKVVRVPVAKTHSARRSIKATDHAIEIRKLNEIAELIWLPENLSTDEKNTRVVRALEFYEDLKPVGSAEGMLAAQMVGTHSAALECLKRSALEDQNFVGSDMYLKHAQKLMTLYTQQLAALNKHRGKGQQKVTVEHVHVHPGGQAVVGNVEMELRGRKGPKEAEAIEHLPNVSTPIETATKKTSKSKRSE